MRIILVGLCVSAWAAGLIGSYYVGNPLSLSASGASETTSLPVQTAGDSWRRTDAGWQKIELPMPSHSAPRFHPSSILHPLAFALLQFLTVLCALLALPTRRGQKAKANE